MNYYAIQCKSCGRWSVRSIDKFSTYKLVCCRCKKTHKLKNKNELGLNLRLSQRFDSLFEAQAFIKSKTESLNTGFETYIRKL